MKRSKEHKQGKAIIKVMLYHEPIVPQSCKTDITAAVEKNGKSTKVIL